MEEIWGSDRHFAPDSWIQRIFIYTSVFPVPLTLLVTGAFYLWVYARRAGRLNGESFGRERWNEPAGAQV